VCIESPTVVEDSWHADILNIIRLVLEPTLKIGFEFVAVGAFVPEQF
jgi:hypothetical protein